MWNDIRSNFQVVWALVPGASVVVQVVGPDCFLVVHRPIDDGYASEVAGQDSNKGPVSIVAADKLALADDFVVA